MTTKTELEKQNKQLRQDLEREHQALRPTGTLSVAYRLDTGAMVAIAASHTGNRQELLALKAALMNLSTQIDSLLLQAVEREATARAGEKTQKD